MQALIENGRNRNRKTILELELVKSRLKKITMMRTKGTVLRSKVRWHEQGEHNTKYFYGLEKRNSQRKRVTKLKIGENVYTDDQFEILEEERRFYEHLYKSTCTGTEKFKDSPFLILRT